MKNYEGMLIIRPDLAEKALQGVTAQIADTITKNGGQMENSQVWGRRQLTYPINKFTEGLFYLIHFKAEPGAISKVKKEYTLNENILRVLIIAAKQGG